MMKVTFDRDRALAVIEHLRTGEPIPAPGPEGWNTSDLLAMAGLFYAMVVSHAGPAHVSAADAKRMSAEFREAYNQTAQDDAVEGLLVCAELARLTARGEYDTAYEPTVQVGVDSARHVLVPVAGCKTASESRT